MTDVHAPDLWPQRRPAMYTPERDAFLRDNRDVPVAILSYKMNLSETFIKRYQRKLGIRKLTGNKPRKSR
jgi:hypothetical protein